MATAIKTPRTIVASSILAATGTVRGTLGLQTALGGILTFAILNGSVGPATQCVANILVAHNSALPAAGSAGATWKTIYSVGNDITANTFGQWSYVIGPEVENLEVEFTGNTVQSVTVEAFFTEITSIG